MKTKLFTLLLAVAASIGTMYASDTQADGIWYNFDSSTKTATVTYRGYSYDSYSNEYIGTVVIPASVTYNNEEYSVTSIGFRAFQGCTTLTSVTIPNSVINIGNLAFFECTSLTSVTIPNSVTSIGGGGAFAACSGLTAIDVAADNPNYSSENGVLFNKDKTTLVSYPGGKLCIYYTIPNSVTDIGSEAFFECTSLTSIVIPDSVTSIGDWAFYNCTGLSSVICNAQTPAVMGIRVFYYYNSRYQEIPLNDIKIYVPCGTLETYQAAEGWSEYASLIKYAPLPYKISTIAENGNVTTTDVTTLTICSPSVTCTATANYGYHFTQWSDGLTDNPRTIEVTQDTTFTAEFAKNTYTISTTSANPEWGITAGGKSALYLDEIEISATPNYGYHFVKWNDNNTSNPRTVSVIGDKTFTATFAKNVYSITKNAERGSISGNSSTEYLDFVTLTVTSDYGYHFTQWSDGFKDNPRIAQITQDTTFTAEFAYDRVGTCGKDLALTWSYDPANKVLTIGNAGSFTENMQFGAEAPNEMEELVIGNSVTAIGANAFTGISSLKKVSFGESVKTIGEQAFFNCVNLETIFNYRPTPTNTYSNAFDGVDKFECTLYVLPSSIDMYKAAAVWRDFYYTYAIGAEETTVTTNDVQVEPQNNAVTLTWPMDDNAASYTIEITKDGVLFCTLIFNADGQLTGIAFAPSRNGSRNIPAATMTAKGLQFTVTGLNSNTQYGYSVTAKDSNEQDVATYSGEFTTTGEDEPTGIDNTSIESITTKLLRDNQIYILRGDKVYTIDGRLVK